MRGYCNVCVCGCVYVWVLVGIFIVELKFRLTSYRELKGDVLDTQYVCNINK